MSDPEDSYVSDPQESTLTFDQACFLAEFTEIKNEIEVEIALRKAFIDDVRELTHELPPLGLEHNMMLIYVLIDRASLNISSDGESSTTLTKTQAYRNRTKDNP
jgi:hypothetical protein